MKLLSGVFLLVLAPLLTVCKEVSLPVDCSDIRSQSQILPTGVYTIYPLGEKSDVQVFCDMESEGGGWTTIQSRMDGSVNFYRPWDEYKMGFGNADREYWFGLDNIHYLTQNQKYELLVYMEDFDQMNATSRYSLFSVDAECDGYALHVTGFADGGAGDFLTPQYGQKFSTFDKDQDAWNLGNCAKSFLGAFWYNMCHSGNPNGIYRLGDDKALNNIGLEWKTWRGQNFSLKILNMKIRPVQK